MASKGAAAMDATGRDQLMKDVMVEAGELRGRLMDICVSSHPQNVAFIDWVIVVSVLSKIGIVDLDDDDVAYRELADPNGWDYEVDDDGRIITLRIYGHGGPLDPFDLPKGIARIERLTDLTVYNCLSLPAKELSSLPYLQTLRLRRCPDILANFPAQMKLNHLKEIYVSESQFRSSSPFVAWMTKQLPSLKTLGFSKMEKNETNCIFDVLQNHDVCFQENLKKLYMLNCNLDDSNLETIFLEILPRFPRMNHLNLGRNRIQSVQSIVDRLKNDKTCFVSKSIRHLGLYGNSVMDKMKEDPQENTAILSFLKTFNTVCNLGAFDEGDYDLDVEYALRINHAGRNIVEGSGDRPLPLSVWPIVLERSFKKSDHIYRPDLRRKQKNLTGLYYLLRNGPALAGRVGLGSNDSGRLLSSSDHAVVGNSGYDVTTKHPLLKRKFVEETSTESVAETSTTTLSNTATATGESPSKRARDYS